MEFILLTLSCACVCDTRVWVFPLQMGDSHIGALFWNLVFEPCRLSVFAASPTSPDLCLAGSLAPETDTQVVPFSGFLC